MCHEVSLRHAAVEANVRSAIRRIRATPEARTREAEGVMKLVSALQSLSTGLVRFLDDQHPPGEWARPRPAPWRVPS